jgi:hypothetical protein
VGVVAALAAVIALLLAGCFGDEDPTTETTVSPDTGEVAPDPDTGEIALDPDTGEIALDPDTGELFDPGEVAHPDTGEISPDTPTGPKPGEARLSPEQEIEAKRKIERIGNEWASRFAVAPNPDVCSEGTAAHPFRGPGKYMGQPLCEHLACQRVGPVVIKNCTPVSQALQYSFADATVEKVVIKGGQAVAARFSNGEVVAIHYVPGHQPYIDGVGGYVVGRGGS